MTPTPEQIRERARWVRSLLDDGLDQGTGALRLYNPTTDRSMYCCLGVRLRQVDPGNDRLVVKPEKGVVCPGGFFESEDGTLSHDHLVALGWDDADQEAAYHFNDDEGWTFEQIARGIAWTTAEDVSFRYLFAAPDPAAADDEEDLPESTTKRLHVPDDFDVRAWLTEVEA